MKVQSKWVNANDRIVKNDGSIGKIKYMTCIYFFKQYMLWVNIKCDDGKNEIAMHSTVFFMDCVV